MSTAQRATAQSGSLPNSDPLQRLLDLAGIGPDQSVAIAGANALDMMLALCRAGQQRVECARQASRSKADGRADLLILSGPPDDLGELTARTACLLGEGGRIAVALRRIEDDQPIRAALAAHSLTIATTIVDLAYGLTVIHRISRPQRVARTG